MREVGAPMRRRSPPWWASSVMATAEELAVSAAGLAGRDEARVRARGRVLLEVTSNMSRPRAHGFSERLGFERTSYRFRKPLGS